MFTAACIIRFLYLAVVFLPLLVVLPFYVYAGGLDDGNDDVVQLNSRATPPLSIRAFHYMLVRALEWGGAAFIKLGQWASTRPDVFPRGLTEALSTLHDRVPAVALWRVRRTVERALAKVGDSEAMVDMVKAGMHGDSSFVDRHHRLTALNIGDVFEEFEDETVGSGCIAQV